MSAERALALALGASLLASALHPQLTGLDDGGPAVAVALAEARARASELERRVVELEATLAAERAERELRESALRIELRALQAELVRVAEERFAREQEWLGFTRALASLSSGTLAPGELARLWGGPLPADAAAPEADAAELALASPASAPTDARAERDEEVRRRLRALLFSEDLHGFEPLETGSLADGATGPVVLRLSDENGRPVGTLSAARLRLEASRSGRALTIVLEDGYERRGGMRYPFEGEAGGVHRIALAGVDPHPWIEACPELFRFEDQGPLVDDGRYKLALVQRALNVLLDEDVGAGHYRLAELGGVVGGTLCDVQLEQLDDQGRAVRSLIADRLTIEALSRGVRLLLEDGVQVRGGHKVAFLDGRYRIFLPQVDEASWIELGLPGLTPIEASPLARDAAMPLPRRLTR